MFGLEEADLPVTYEGEPEAEPAAARAHSGYLDAVLSEYESAGIERVESPGLVPIEAEPWRRPETLLDAEELIAELRASVREKDSVILRAALLNVDLQQEIETANSQTGELQQKLTEAVKTSESLTTKAAAKAASPPGTWRSDADAARMEQQFRLAQKALEKEFARLKDELVVTKGELHRSNQQLEMQARNRRVEAAQASAKISTLERQVNETVTAANAAGAEHVISGARARTRLTFATAVTAVILLAFGIWSQLGLGHSNPAPAAVVHAEETPAPEIHTARYVTPSSAPAEAGQLTSFGGSQAAFQRSLGRLNEVLSVPTGRTPEQVLRDVRQSAAKAGIKVCEFEWNGGQPALVYGGGGASLDSSLNRCASAVESFVAGKAPTAKQNPDH